MIGLGVSLMTLGFIGIVISDRMEIQRREDWVLVGQRAGASVSSLTMNLSIGEYNLRVWLWVHNYTDGFYAISDINGNQIVILSLVATEQLNEWKLNDLYFQIIDQGCYTFELFNATFSSIHSTAKLYYHTHVDAYLYPYRSLFWFGIFSLVIGTPLIVVGLVNPLIPNPKN
jgi:hypothetical protein